MYSTASSLSTQTLPALLTTNDRLANKHVSPLLKVFSVGCHFDMVHQTFKTRPDTHMYSTNTCIFINKGLITPTEGTNSMCPPLLASQNWKECLYNLGASRCYRDDNCEGNEICCPGTCGRRI